MDHVIYLRSAQRARARDRRRTWLLVMVTFALGALCAGLSLPT